MKQFLLLILMVSSVSLLNAQLISGTKLTGNIVTTDINGNAVDIYADLDSGKSVVIDVFATWCGPCWSFHKSGFLEEVYDVLGPDGTNQIRVYGIEGDGTTPLSDIFMASSSSIGDWTEGVKYSLINDDSFNSLLKIAFFPTLYIIRPDRTVIEMGDFRYNSAIWEKALVPTAEKDLVFGSGLDSKTFCATAIFNQKPAVINMGTTAVSSVDMDLVINGVSTLSSVDQSIGVFEQANINLGTKTINESSTIEVIIEAVDGVADEADNISKLSATFSRPLVTEKTFTLKVTTDFYPGETTWKLKDNKGATIDVGSFNAGPEADGGGGDDANKEFSYDIALSNIDINCLTLTITDSYGDGLTAFNSTHPVPGVEIVAADGTVLKPKFTSDYAFTTSKPVFAGADIVSSLEDQDFVSNLNVYPNPVADVLNIDMSINAGTEYEVFVTNIMGANVSNVLKNTNFLNVSNLTGGMYFLNVRTKDGVFAHKFTKI